MVADHALIPACLPDGQRSVFVVPSDAVGREREVTTAGQVDATFSLEGVEVTPNDLLGAVGGGDDVVEWTRLRATALLSAMTAGVCAEALRLTAAYVSERTQFGRVLASFQAVSQRAADAYIDTEAVRLTAWQALWALQLERASARADVAVAKYWAAHAGQRVVHAAQHLHGGVGMDRTYPVHRYFLWAKQLELALGGSTSQLLRLADEIDVDLDEVDTVA